MKKNIKSNNPMGKILMVILFLFSISAKSEWIYNNQDSIKRSIAGKYFFTSRGNHDSTFNIKYQTNPFKIIDRYFYTDMDKLIENEKFRFNIVIDSCMFNKSKVDDDEIRYYGPAKGKYFILSNSKSNQTINIGRSTQNSEIRNEYSIFRLSDNAFKEIRISGTDVLNESSIYGCNSESIILDNNRFNSLTISNNTTDHIGVYSSTFYDNLSLIIDNKFYKKGEIYKTIILSTDSILGRLQIELMYNDTIDEVVQGMHVFVVDDDRRRVPALLEIDDSYLDAFIDAGLSQFSFKRVTFENCSFGKRTHISIQADTLLFINCKNFETEININNLIPVRFANEKHNKFAICLTGSDISKFNISYGDNFVIIPSFTKKDVYHMKNTSEILDNSESNYQKLYEDNISTFQLLVEKFRDEGKEKSMVKMDLQLRRYVYDYNSGLVNWLSYYPPKLFWKFGHSKFRPVIWLIMLLFIFAFINLINWNKMNETFTLDEKDKITMLLNKKGDVRIYSIVNFLWALFYTSMIFFSIRITPDMLKFNNNGKFILSYVIQYLLGVFLILFIANFIFNAS